MRKVPSLSTDGCLESACPYPNAGYCFFAGFPKRRMPAADGMSFRRCLSGGGDIFSKSVEKQGGANRTFATGGRCHGWQLEPCPCGLEPLLTFRQKIPTGRPYIEEGCSVRRGHLGFFVNPVKNHLHILQAVHEGGSIYKSS